MKRAEKKVNMNNEYERKLLEVVTKQQQQKMNECGKSVGKKLFLMWGCGTDCFIY